MDNTCGIRVRMVGVGFVVVEQMDADIRTAIDYAAARIGRTVARKPDRTLHRYACSRLTLRAQFKVLVPALLLFLAGPLRAQEEERAIDHARQVLELLQQGSFDRVGSLVREGLSTDL